MLTELEPQEPYEALASDTAFEHRMKVASLSLLRAMERARGLYPITPAVQERRPRPPRLTPRRVFGEALGRGIVRAVAAQFDLSHEEITGRKRATRFICARVVAVRLLRDQRWADGSARFSTPQIGRMLARDHSTIIHALRNFEPYCARFPFLREIYEDLGGCG